MRQSYALETLTAMTEWLFKCGAHRAFAECDPQNIPSWRLLERAGFRREAHLRQNIWFFKDENDCPIWKDTYVYAKLESEL